MSRRGLRWFERVWPPVIAVLAILVVWQVATDDHWVDANSLPSPTHILSQGWSNHGPLLSNTWPTLEATVAGFTASILVAFALSVALDFSHLLRRAIVPVLIISQTLPIVAIAPLVILWFGFGFTPKILLVALVTFFPMVIALLQGFASAELDAERLLASMGAGRRTIFVKLRLPAAMPSFFSGLRISVTYAVVGAIFAEYAGAISGLGVYMQEAKNSFQTPLVFAAVLVSALLTLILFTIVALIERLALPWLAIEHGERAGR